MQLKQPLARVSLQVERLLFPNPKSGDPDTLHHSLSTASLSSPPGFLMVLRRVRRDWPPNRWIRRLLHRHRYECTPVIAPYHKILSAPTFSVRDRDVPVVEHPRDLPRSEGMCTKLLLVVLID